MEPDRSPLQEQPRPPSLEAESYQRARDFVSLFAAVVFGKSDKGSHALELLNAVLDPSELDSAERTTDSSSPDEAPGDRPGSPDRVANRADLRDALRELEKRLARAESAKKKKPRPAEAESGAVPASSAPPGGALEDAGEELEHLDELMHAATATFFLLSRVAEVLLEDEPSAAEALASRGELDVRLRRIRTFLRALNQKRELSVPYWRILEHPSKESPERWEILLSVLEALKVKGTKRALLSVLDLIHGHSAPRVLKSIEQLIEASKSAAPDASYHVVPDIYGRNFHLLTDVREEPLFREIAEPVVSMGKSFLYYDRLYNLYEAISNVSRAHPERSLNVAEIGVFRGGTSYFLCKLLEKLRPGQAKFFAVDTFEGHSSLDLPNGAEGAHTAGVFSKTSYDEVVALLAEFPFATIIKSRIQDCTGQLGDGEFDFVHLDMDLFHPIYYSLKFFVPRLAVGGILCVDDYNKKSCPGVRQAVERFLQEEKIPLTALYTQTAQCLLIRNAMNALP